MTVQELIQLLSRQPADMRVVVRGYENGVNDVDEVRLVHITLDVSTSWWRGQHDADFEPGENTIPALELHGTNRKALP